MLPEGVKPWYQEWREEGVQEGLERGRRRGVREGREKGVREGEARLLARQLTIRFGKLPAEVRGRLQKARSKDLMRWAERCLTAGSLEDVFGD